MKTLKPSFNSDRNLSLLNINIGSILSEQNSTTLKNSKFVVAGISLTDYALVRIYEQQDINPAAINSAYFINLKIPALASPLNEEGVVYVDCSKLVLRRFGKIGLWLKKHPDSFVGKLHEADMNKVINVIKNAQTISKNTKVEYYLNA